MNYEISTKGMRYVAIQDKVVVIMGAASEIEEATTKKLAGEGLKLVIAARREE